MKLKLDKKKLMSLVETYYKETENIVGRAISNCSKELTGYGMGEHEDCVVRIKFTYTKNIMGMELPNEIAIDEKKLEEIVKYFLEKENMKLDRMDFDSGLSSHTTGYGMGETTSYTPYFRGIEVYVTEKAKPNIKNLKLYNGCLIVVDMVNGFVNEGVLHDKEISRVIPRQIELIKEAKNDGKAIVFIKDTHSKDSVEFERFGNQPHCLINSPESKLVKELKGYEDGDNTISIPKNSTNFMEAPEFRKFMEEQTKLEEFDVVGCCTDICVFEGTMGLAGYLDQWNRKHNIRVHKDAIATYAEADRQEYVKAAELLMEQRGIQLVKKMDR